MTDVPVDWTDPCARAAALRDAYYRMVSGQQETEIRTRTLDAEEMVRFGPGNLDALRNDLSAAETECLAKLAGQAVSPKRFAIGLRHKRPAFDRTPGRDPFWR